MHQQQVNMKKIVTVFILLITIVSVNGQSKEWTLAECVAYALENNISVKQS